MFTPTPAVPSLEAAALFDVLTKAEGPVLDKLFALLDELLRTGQATSRPDRLHLITLRHVLLLRREAEELAANPTLRHERMAAASRFARKAQSGFSPLPLPE